MILATNHVLELLNVTHTGQVEEGSCLQTVFGSVPTGLVLKDVCLEVRGGEVMAVLGSKGSGKRALLEVLSGRGLGPTKGQIILNGVSLSLKLFQQCCAFVSQRVDLVPGLTVRQTLAYAAMATIGSKVSAGMKRTRVKQVMADMALHQVASQDISSLSSSEYRRLTIGVQLIRDPVVLLLDEPTADLDPLNTYFIISILSNHAKKYSRIVILTMEKPRSDIFPFLDRVTYLCMGDVVYTGSSRMMMDYFRNIGFPCPELENPLMYYLCLATVDRRSRERLIDSTNQIGALIEKFRLEGAPFRKSVSPSLEMVALNPYSKVSLTVYGSPSSWAVFWILIRRMWRIPLNGLSTFNPDGLRHVFLRWLLLPVVFTLLFLFYFRLTDLQRSFISRNGLLFSCLALTAYLSAAITAATFARHRTRYYQESREAIYGGPLFVLSHVFYGLPISAISMFVASTIIYWATGLRPEAWRWLSFSGSLWTVYLFVEFQTTALMALVKSSYSAANVSIFLNTLCLTTASGNLRSLLLLPEWLYYLSFATIFRYAGALLNENEFMDSLPALASNGNESCSAPNAAQGCVYVNGTHFLSERYHMIRSERYANDLEMTRNMVLCFGFCAAMLLMNLLLYLAPLPAFLKSKFRK